VFIGSGFEAWTSGTNDGIGCLRKPGWCPSGDFISSDLKWGGGERTDPGNENGIALALNPGAVTNSYLKDYSTTTKMFYICEVCHFSIITTLISSKRHIVLIFNSVSFVI